MEGGHVMKLFGVLALVVALGPPVYAQVDLVGEWGQRQHEDPGTILPKLAQVSESLKTHSRSMYTNLLERANGVA